MKSFRNLITCPWCGVNFESKWVRVVCTDTGRLTDRVKQGPNPKNRLEYNHVFNEAMEFSASQKKKAAFGIKPRWDHGGYYGYFKGKHQLGASLYCKKRCLVEHLEHLARLEQAAHKQFGGRTADRIIIDDTLAF